MCGEYIDAERDLKLLQVVLTVPTTYQFPPSILFVHYIRTRPINKHDNDEDIIVRDGRVRSAAPTKSS